MGRISIRQVSFIFGLLSLSGFISCHSEASVTYVPPTVQQINHYLDDSIVTARVKSFLLAKPQLAIDDLSLTTSQGIVQISGYIASQANRRQVTKWVRHLDGVRGVKNQLQIQAPAPLNLKRYVSDVAITGEIRGRLMASENSNIRQVEVTTRQGRVYLSGNLRNRQQQHQVLQVVKQVAGVEKIVQNWPKPKA